MFEKTCDIFLQQAYSSTKPIPSEDFLTYFKLLRKPKLQLMIKDTSSFMCYKEKLIEMEKNLAESTTIDTNKLILPLIGFAKIYVNFCQIDSNLMQIKLNAFPSMIFTQIFKFLQESISDSSENISNIEVFYQEIEEFIYEMNESIEENCLIIGNSSTIKLFHHILNILFNENLMNFPKHQQNIYKNITNINVFLYAKTNEENDKKLMIEEMFIRMNSPIKYMNITLENSQNINILSYFFLKLPQNQLSVILFNNPGISFTKDGILSENSQEFITKTMQNSMKLIRNVVGFLFRKSKEDLKSKTNIHRFMRIFLRNIVETVENPEVLTSVFYYQAFMNMIIEFLHQNKGESDNLYKGLLLDFIREFLISFIEIEGFLKGKKERILQLLGKEDEENREKTTTSTNLKKKKEKSIKNEKNQENEKIEEKNEKKEKMSTSTKKSRNSEENTRNSQENTRNSCSLCSLDLSSSSETTIISNFPSEKPSKSSEICLICYLKSLIPQLSLPKKPDFSLEKLLKTAKNPLFFYIFLYFLNEKSLNSSKFHSSRSFFLANLLYQCQISIKKSYIPYIIFFISSNFLQKTAISFIKDSSYFPNEFLIKFSLLSIDFSPEIEKFSEIFKNLLLVFSNENITIRNKVLDILLNIVGKKPEMIYEAKIQEIITQRVQDSAVSVRNSALMIIMKFFSDNFNEENGYFEILLERINDIDCNLRKKILGFFRENAKFLKKNEEIMKKVLKAAVYKIYDNEEIAALALNFTCSLIFESFEQGIAIKKLKKSEKLEKDENSEKNEKRGKIAKFSKFEKSENSENSEKSEKIEKPEKLKKGAKNEKLPKLEKLTKFEKMAQNKENIKRNIRLIRDLCIELKNNDWLNKVIKYSMKISKENTINESEIECFIGCLITDLAENHQKTGISEENLVNLEMLLGFSRYYPIFLQKELNFFTNYLKFLSDTSNLLSKKQENQAINTLFSLRKSSILLLLDILDSILSIKSEKEVKNSIFLSNFIEIEQFLIKFIQEEALEILHKSLKLLILSVKIATSNYFLIKNIYIQTYAFVLKKKLVFSVEKDQDNSVFSIDNLQNFMRCLYILTFLTRYFDISEFFDEEEREKPEFHEEKLIKIIFNELIFFCKYKNAIIEQTCIECIMILWEKLPILIFETRLFIEKYLMDVSEEKREIVEKIYSCFVNLLLRQDEKIQRQNSWKRENNKKKLENDKEKKWKGQKQKKKEAGFKKFNE